MMFYFVVWDPSYRFQDFHFSTCLLSIHLCYNLTKVSKVKICSCLQGKKEDVTLKKLGVKNVRKMLGGALAVLMLVGGLGMTANASGIDVEQTDDATTWTEANNDYGYWYVNKVTKECVTPGWHVQHTKDRDTNVKYQYDFYVDSNGYVKWSNLFIDGYQSNTKSGQKKWDWKSDANGWYYTNGEE